MPGASNYYYSPYSLVPPILTIPPATYLYVVCYGIFTVLNEMAQQQDPPADLLWCVTSPTLSPENWVILGNETVEATYEDRPEGPPEFPLYYEKIIRYRRENVAKGIIAMAKGNLKMTKEFIKTAKFQIVPPPFTGTSGWGGPIIVPQGIQLPLTGWLSTFPVDILSEE